MDAGRLVEREEVVAMLFAIADLNAKVGRILQLLEEELGGGEALSETTPEEWTRWRENQVRLERAIERALAERGTTREEIARRVGLSNRPSSPRLGRRA